MKFKELLEIVKDEPLFETGLLLAGADERDVRKQLSRWTKTGKLIQIRRGLYALAPPHQKRRPHPFLTANHLVQGSYVSCESALAYYGLIPEYVPVTISVSVSRPGRKESPLGIFQYHHISQKLFYGYHAAETAPNQHAFIAFPEKALLDLVHLKTKGFEYEYLQSLRLQHLDKLDIPRLFEFAERTRSKKLARACENIKCIADQEKNGYKNL